MTADLVSKMAPLSSMIGTGNSYPGRTLIMHFVLYAPRFKRPLRLTRSMKIGAVTSSKSVKFARPVSQLISLSMTRL